MSIGADAGNKFALLRTQGTDIDLLGAVLSQAFTLPSNPTVLEFDFAFAVVGQEPILDPENPSFFGDTLQVTLEDGQGRPPLFLADVSAPSPDFSHFVLDLTDPALFTPALSSGVTLTFDLLNEDDGNASEARIDGVAVQGGGPPPPPPPPPIAGPPTVVLLAVGLAGLGALRSRKDRAS